MKGLKNAVMNAGIEEREMGAVGRGRWNPYSRRKTKRRFVVTGVAAVVLLSLASYLQVLIRYRGEEKQSETTFQTVKNDSLLYAGMHERAQLIRGCLHDVVTVKPDGRLGNFFMYWLSAFAVARWLNKAVPEDQQRVVALETSMWRSLTRAFDGVVATPLNIILQNRFTPQGTPCSNFTDENVFWALEKNVKETLIQPRLAEGGVPLCLPKWSVFSEAISRFGVDVLAKVRVKRKYMDPAAQLLRRLAQRTSEATGMPPHRVVFVSIHARRTDYTDWLKEKRGAKPATVRYYQRALHWMIGALRANDSGCSQTTSMLTAMTIGTTQEVQQNMRPYSHRKETLRMSFNDSLPLTQHAPVTTATLAKLGSFAAQITIKTKTMIEAQTKTMDRRATMNTKIESEPNKVKREIKSIETVNILGKKTMKIEIGKEKREPPRNSNKFGFKYPPIAAVVVSDDMWWVNETLIPALRKFIRSEKVPAVLVFAGGQGTPWSSLQDLALLSLCNHSIVSYGTYGTMAALLAGGRTVVYNIKQPDYFTLELAENLPHWVTML